MVKNDLWRSGIALEIWKIYFKYDYFTAPACQQEQLEERQLNIIHDFFPVDDPPLKWFIQ